VGTAPAADNEATRLDARRAAMVTATLALVAYAMTVAPGVSFGDWAEAQMMPPTLGVMHPTGYPLYVLLGKAFSVIPAGSVAYRMNLFSAVVAACAVGMSVLIAVRIGVRPIVATFAALTLALSDALWLEATFAEMNGLHLLLVALVIHRALVWREERRDRDLLVGALLAGLSLSNHPLAATAVPIIVVWVIVLARRRLAVRPALLAQAALAFVAGLTPYLFVPIRAAAGPPELYAGLTTWDGFRDLVTGAQFRREMTFLSGDALAASWRALPDVVARLQEGSNLAVLVGAVVGAFLLVRWDRSVGVLFTVLVATNVHFYVNYRGDLPHYLLLTWLVVGVWLAVAGERLAKFLDSPLRGRLRWATVVLVLVPLSVGASNWAARDQSRNHLGNEYTDRVFELLPQDAVLVTYWDSLNPLSYRHCIEGVRPDVMLRTVDDTARALCDPLDVPLEQLAVERPIFALEVQESHKRVLEQTFRLMPGPMIKAPFGQRVPEYDRPLYRLELKGWLAP